MQITKQITVFSGVLIKNNKVLLAQRSEKECADAHMKWELPGGKVHIDETPQEAVAREFLEETGITIRVRNLLPVVQTNYWKYAWGLQQTLCFYFICEFISEQERKSDHHIADVKWFSLSEVKKIDSLPGTKETITAVKKLLTRKKKTSIKQ